jgi:hypothetical protein
VRRTHSGQQTSEQIQATIDALTLAHTQAALVSHTMRKQRASFGLDYSHMDDDIAQVTSKLRYLKRLAERRESAEAATERYMTPD